MPAMSISASDHFAKESDDLVKAQQHGSLHRNFQGYSTNADCDMIAMGVTAISRIGDNYSQNVRTIEEYKSYLDQEEDPHISRHRARG